MEPDERVTSVSDQKHEIKYLLSTDNGIIYVAEDNGKLIGYLKAFGGIFKRNRHNVNLVIGIIKSYTGQGIDTLLFKEIEKWAYQNKIYRLELSTMTNNNKALALFRKMGFEIEGKKEHALFVNGSYVDEYYMAKSLS